MDESVHILLLEDDPAHAELIKRAFEERGSLARLVIAGTLGEARAAIETLTPTLIIADWRLPDGDSRELLSAEPGGSSPPVIIMTSYGSERHAVEAIKAGALDYIVKSSESMADMPHLAERAIKQWQAALEQERMQLALAESEAQFRLLAENSSDMITRHRPDLSLIYVSPACRTLLGYEPEELLNRSMLTLIHPHDSIKILQLLSESRLSEIMNPPAYRAQRKNGSYVWLETTAHPIFDSQNNLVEYQASSRDVTERREAQIALQHTLAELQDAYDKTIEGWVIALDLRDKETEGHTQRVTELAVRLAQEFNCTVVELAHIRRGALLHDMGKIGIPDEILQKPGALTAEEWEIMRKHPQYAQQMLSRIGYLHDALVIPYCHHERWDGSGYPQGLKAEEIPLFARLFAVVDVWDALSSDRPYRKRLPPEDVIKYLRKEAGRLFDPHVVEVFLRLIHSDPTSA
ncbi:MAG: PAS domain S-box protein [Anaerolineales bacterium]|nr:PAS domain S-box protein [Anaerolineales bacterium]